MRDSLCSASLAAAGHLSADIAGPLSAEPCCLLPPLSPGNLQNRLCCLVAGSAGLGRGSRQTSLGQRYLLLLQGQSAGSRAEDPGMACC